MNPLLFPVLAIPLMLGACNSSTTTTSSSSSDTDNFPSGLAVSSPFDLVDDDSSSRKLNRAVTITGKKTRYAWITARIDKVLNGTTPVHSAFDPDLFFNFANSADCFGPNVNYENHPNGSGANTGQLPSGDLGIWQETESSGGHACTAAELNAQLSGVREQTRGGLMIVASMISVVNSNSLTLPSAGSSLAITSELDTAITDTNITVNSASITQNSDNSWTYQINFDYTKTWDGSGDYTHKVFVRLDHTPSSSGTANEYSGLLAYWISGDSGDTHFPGGNCANTEDRTYNGSVKYERDSQTEMQVQARSATFCGTEVDGRIVSTDIDNGMVDDDLTYNGSNNGWSENFSIFATEFDPISLAGKYSYVWQAGSNDSNTRIFNIGVSVSNSTLVGESYFGYGDPIATTDGAIQSFICNWAGPNGGVSLTDRTYVDRLQRQHFTLDTSTGIFEPTNSGASNIVYAPTNDCDYDGTAPNGFFVYDTDGDNLTSDETHQAVTNDLWKGTVQNQTDGDTLPDIVTMRGFSLTSITGGWPSEN